ncbi:MAG: hypothetical protein M1834_001357 [Cirrosporium novae-zelandiae]|nr:MAG: hypothetical protein M1834_001357 [Cirrosporium novae-zelandiae]
MSLLKSLVPLVAIILLLGVIAFVIFVAYQVANDVGTKTKEKLERKNMAFGKDGGLTVGVKARKNEEYVDKTQSVLVKAWNLSSNAPKRKDSRPRLSVSGRK